MKKILYEKRLAYEIIFFHVYYLFFPSFFPLFTHFHHLTTSHQQKFQLFFCNISSACFVIENNCSRLYYIIILPIIILYQSIQCPLLVFVIFRFRPVVELCCNKATVRKLIFNVSLFPKNKIMWSFSWNW